jgi:hypothetical protein
MGSVQLAAAVVTTRGHGVQHAARRTGLVGEATRYAAARHAGQHPSQIPKFSRTAFLAVNDREVALIKTRATGLKGLIVQAQAGGPAELEAILGVKVDLGSAPGIPWTQVAHIRDRLARRDLRQRDRT